MISADGNVVAFASSASNLGGEEGAVFVRNLRDATTSAAGVGAPGGLSADGACLMAQALAPGRTRDFDRVLLIAVRGACDITTGPPPSGGPGQQPADPTASAPDLRGLRLSRTRFPVGPAGTARIAGARRGTVVRYVLDRPAAVTLKVQRRDDGRWVRKGKLRRRSPAGVSRVRFSGRIGRRALRPGRYRLVARATDAAGRVRPRGACASGFCAPADAPRRPGRRRAVV